jgi:hypothetical protein
MGISTKNANVQLDKKQKVALMLDYHRAKIKKDGESDPLFSPKMFFYAPQVKGDRVIMVFQSEMENQKDLYFEVVTKEYEPIDPRTLYKWKFNPHYKEEYVERTNSASGSKQYLIPESEIETLGERELFEDAEFEDEIPDPNQDMPMSNMSVRDFAAIMWKTPISKNKMINQLIIQHSK